MTQRPIALALRQTATRVSSRSRGLLPVAATVVLAALAGSANAAVLIVNTDDDTREDRCDARHCTLREAIQAANNFPRGAEIRFALPVSPYRIDVRRPLPALRGGVTLDGTRQPGTACPSPVVHIDGTAITSASAVNGLEIRGDGNRVRGLVITGFSGHGILVAGSENLLQCLFVGVDPTGREARGNGGHGIAVSGGHSNVVGGPAPEDGNLLSANGGQGLTIEDALNTHMAYNGVGIDALGLPRLPNGNAELPPLNPPPALPRLRDPRAIEAVTRAAERRAAEIAGEPGDVLENSGLYEKYLRFIEAERGDEPPPADLSELMTLLVGHPTLYGAFTTEAAGVLKQAADETAAALDRLRRAVRVVLPAFGDSRPHRAQGKFDVLSDTLSEYSLAETVTSGAPSQLLAVDTDELPTVQHFSWHSLTTYGPKTFNDTDYYFWVEHPYPDATAPFPFPGASFLSYTCLNIANLPSLPLAPCHWPIIYDLLPFSVQLLWQSETLTQQQIEDIVTQEGYFLQLLVNNQPLNLGPPPPVTHTGTLATDDIPPWQGFYAASVPGGPSPKICPAGRNCLATVVLVQQALANIPQPWVFELRVKKPVPLAMPIIKGVDELGNPIVITHELKAFAQTSRTVLPNPETGGEKWFVASLYDTFKHPRCSDCHAFGNFDNIAAHHGYEDTEAFVSKTGLHLEPSLYVPGAHVMACNNCHWPGESLPKSQFQALIETEWRAPYQDLDVDCERRCADLRAREVQPANLGIAFSASERRRPAGLGHRGRMGPNRAALARWYGTAAQLAGVPTPRESVEQFRRPLPLEPSDAWRERSSLVATP